jgi:hypothetical protein
MYCIQHCFICHPSDSTVSVDAGMEPGQLRLRYWLSDALTTRLNLIHHLFFVCHVQASLCCCFHSILSPIYLKHTQMKCCTTNKDALTKRPCTYHPLYVFYKGSSSLRLYVPWTVNTPAKKPRIYVQVSFWQIFIDWENLANLEVYLLWSTKGKAAPLLIMTLFLLVIFFMLGAIRCFAQLSLSVAYSEGNCFAEVSIL